MEKSKFREHHTHPIEVYEAVQQIPILNDKRRCTDILCIIVGLALTITLAVFAIITFNKPQYLKQVFPADSDGNTCGYEYPGYNYIYFAKPTIMTDRLCVRSCPTTKDKPLTCKKTSKLDCAFGSSVQFYETDAVENEYGMFCLPKDEGNRKVLMDQMSSYKRDLYYNSVNTTGKSLAFVAIASLIYMFLVQCCPRVMNRVAVVVGALALIAFTATIMLYPSNIPSGFRWVVFIIAVFFVLIMICTFAKYWQVWGLNGVFLDFGTKFAAHRLYVFILPIVFLAMGVAFYFFEILMYRSFWSFGELRFDPAIDLYHHVKNPTKNLLLTLFQVIQIIWGTMFLKEAFNYLISAEAVEWYYGKGSACVNGAFTLVCKHLGSVIACAFMNAFFGIADFIFDALIPPLDDENSCFYCINRFAGFFDLARSDSLTLVYLSGNAYCNSARYSEYLHVKSSLSSRVTRSLRTGADSDSQSVSRIYRFTAHFALAGIITLVAFWVFGYSLKQEVAIPAMLILLFVSMGVATFFISLHADAGEAIMVLFLMEEEFALRRQKAQPTSRFNQINEEINKYSGSHPSQERRQP